MTTTIETTVRAGERRWSGEVTTRRDRYGSPVWPIFAGVTLAEAIADRREGEALRRLMGVGYWGRLTVDGLAIDAAWDPAPVEPDCPRRGAGECDARDWDDGHCRHHRTAVTPGRDHAGWSSRDEVAWLAERDGRVRVRLKVTAEDLLTVSQVAGHLGITPGRVRVLARTRGVGRRLGRDWLFSEDHLAALAVRRPGRPPGERRSELLSGP